MTAAPDTIVLKRDRDLVGRRHEIWVRRGLFALVPVVLLLALLNLFGQRPHDTVATAATASLRVHAPTRVRSGLLYEGRFTVEARREVRDAVLVLDHGWFDGMTVNTIEPSPKDERSADGDPALELGRIEAGTRHVLFLQFQVDPTTVGRRSQTVRLFDGDRLLLTLHRPLTVYP